MIAPCESVPSFPRPNIWDFKNPESREKVLSQLSSLITERRGEMGALLGLMFTRDLHWEEMGPEGRKLMIYYASFAVCLAENYAENYAAANPSEGL